MAVILSVEYKAQLIVELTSEACNLPKEERSKVCNNFDQFVKEHLEDDFYKDVKIDPQYKRYGLDIGLISMSKDKLDAACHDISLYTREQPHLKDIMFDSFEN